MIGAARGGVTQRRSSPRHGFACKARFREPYTVEAEPWRNCVTRDFSRAGLYFIADGGWIREGMQLLLQFPECLPSVQDREYLVEVLRLDSLPEERCGVGARLILTALAGRCENLFVARSGRSREEFPDAAPRLIDLYA